MLNLYHKFLVLINKLRNIWRAYFSNDVLMVKIIKDLINNNFTTCKAIFSIVGEHDAIAYNSEDA